MEGITVGQIVANLAIIAGIIGSIGVIGKVIASWMKKWLESGLKPLNDKLDKLGKDLKRVDVGACKNYLVRTLAELEAGQELDEVSKERFMECYAEYRDLGGNGYIKARVEKLQKEGKL